MEPGKSKLSDLGSQLDQALVEATRPADQIRAAREQVLYRVALGSLRSARSGGAFFPAWRRALALGVPAAAALVAAVLWFSPRTPISFEIGGTGVPAGIGTLITAGQGESVPLSFSEGSSVVVHPGGRLRVLGAQADGAHVLVDSGAVDVAITHRAGRKADWLFDAGPLSVQVTGTRFHLAWDPREQRFALGISEGSVVVSGSCLERSSVVHAGERLDVECAESPRREALALGSSEAESPVPFDAGRPLEATSAPRPQVSAAPVEKSWRELLHNGDLPHALTLAERAGFPDVCAKASPSELLGLADAARLGGDIAKATVALTALRQRFPGSANAAAAAFSLGRIAFERRAAYAEAVRWFSTYLSEAPAGPLMGDAVGRLMEARQRQGDRAGARSDAESYLRRFPKGPYATLARRLLAE